jgi:hypothetical protein
MAPRKRTGDGTREYGEIHLRTGGWEDEDEKGGQSAGSRTGGTRPQLVPLPWTNKDEEARGLT